MGKQPGWGERACPKCRETIKFDALVCKHCGYAFSDEEIAQAKKDAASNNKLAGIGCLIIVLLLGFCTYSVSGGPDIPEKPTANAKADLIAFYKEIMSELVPCDQASGRVAAAADAGDVIELYRRAEEMESACLTTPTKIRSVEVPASVGKAMYEELTKTQEACSNAYLAKWSAAGRIKAVFDDGGIGRQAGLKSDTEAMQAGTLACASGLVSQSMKLGVSGADLGLNVEVRN